MFSTKPTTTADAEAQPSHLMKPSSRQHRPLSAWRRLVHRNPAAATTTPWKEPQTGKSQVTTKIDRPAPSCSTTSTTGNTSSASLLKVPASTATTLQQNANNPLAFLQMQCAEEVLPTVLAYAGPQTTAVLYRTNRHWKNLLDQDKVWKTLCIELYKWKEGDEEPTGSWMDFYRTSPCVPIDYPTVEAALKLAQAPTPAASRFSASQRRQPVTKQDKSIRILLRPGTFYLQEGGIHIQAEPGVQITLESMTLPETCRWYRSTMPPPPSKETSSTVGVERPMNSAAAIVRASPPIRSLFQMLRCGPRNHNFLGRGNNNGREEPTEHSSYSGEDEADDEYYHTVQEVESHSVEEEYPIVAIVPPKRATLVLRTRRNNEPMFRIRQGHVQLKGLNISHESLGLDIWNGNAAIQIQPNTPSTPEEDEATPPALPEALRPRASISQCRIRSRSGRGVVNIDGGHVNVSQCFIAGCAATGLYVGGPGSSATVDRTDIYSNGRGNPRRRGIARGHSGVYLEQGNASLNECLIAGNTLTGLSSVSYEKAFLTLTNSTIAQNGTHQMELPPLGTNARNKSFIDNNDLTATELSSRSGLWQTV